MYTPPINEHCDTNCKECKLAYLCTKSTVERPNLTRDMIQSVKKSLMDFEIESYRIKCIYDDLAMQMAKDCFPTIFQFHLPDGKDSDTKAKERLREILLSMLIKGWNDCFEYNVKQNKEIKL